MRATGSMNATAHNSVESVSPNEWEDEASFETSGTAPGTGQHEDQSAMAKNLRSAASALRSSFTALRTGSVTGPRTSSSGRRESATGGFVGSLLHGLANAVGLHPRDGSPPHVHNPRDRSSLDLSVGRARRTSSQTHFVGRLGSAAFMRTEIQNLGQFGDLRNDSFTSPSCSKLRRKSSTLLPRLSDASITGPIPAILTASSGDLDRRSASVVPPYIASPRLTCPGELPSPSAAAGVSAASSSGVHFAAAAAAATAAALAAAMPPSRDALVSSSGDAAAAAAASDAVGGSGLRVRRTSIGGPPLQSSLLVEIPALSPHPPSHPPPQNRPSGSSLSPSPSPSLSYSGDHLPPMTPSGRTPVRDRPPTPRSRTSQSGSPSTTLARVLSSFHLPEIIGSGRSVTERRSSVAGNGISGSSASFTRPADFGMPRSRRNSISSGPSVTAMGASGGGAAAMGPGGAAISASLAKRAAAAAAAASASGSNAVGGSSLPPSPALGTARPGSTSSVKAPNQQGSILQDFHSSLELEDDSALAAMDAEFDRRFGQPLTVASADVDGASPVSLQQQPHRLQHLKYPSQPALPPQPLAPPSAQQPQGPSPPQQPQVMVMTPRAPSSEKTSTSGAPRRHYVVADSSSSRTSNPSAGSDALDGRGGGGEGGGGGGPVMCRAPRRASCSSTMTFDGADDVCLDQAALSSMDAVPVYESHRMRLASIRLSCAEGIIAPTPGSSGASLELPPAALSARGGGPPARWVPPSPTGATAAAPPTSMPPLIGRPMGPTHPVVAVASGAVM